MSVEIIRFGDIARNAEDSKLDELMKETAGRLDRLPIKDAQEERFGACKLIIRGSRDFDKYKELLFPLYSELHQFLVNVPATHILCDHAAQILYALSLMPNGADFDKALEAYKRKFLPLTNTLTRPGAYLLLDALFTACSDQPLAKEMSEMLLPAVAEYGKDVRVQAWKLATFTKMRRTVSDSVANKLANTICLEALGDKSVDHRCLEYLAIACSKRGRCSSLVPLLQDGLEMYRNDLNPFTVQVIISSLSRQGKLNKKCLAVVKEGVGSSVAGFAVAKYPDRRLMQFIQSLTHAEACEDRRSVALSTLLCTSDRVSSLSPTHCAIIAESLFRLDLPWSSIGHLCHDLITKVCEESQDVSTQGVVYLLSTLAHLSKVQAGSGVYEDLLQLFTSRSPQLAHQFRSASQRECSMAMARMQELGLSLPSFSDIISLMLPHFQPNHYSTHVTYALDVMKYLRYVAMAKTNPTQLRELVRPILNLSKLCDGDFLHIAWCLVANGKGVGFMGESLRLKFPVDMALGSDRLERLFAIQELFWLWQGWRYAPQEMPPVLVKALQGRDRLSLSVSQPALEKLVSIVGRRAAQLDVTHELGFRIPCLILLQRAEDNTLAVIDYDGQPHSGMELRSRGIVQCAVIPVVKDCLLIGEIYDAPAAQIPQKMKGDLRVIAAVLKKYLYHPVFVPASDVLESPSPSEAWSAIVQSIGLRLDAGNTD